MSKEDRRRGEGQGRERGIREGAREKGKEGTPEGAKAREDLTQRYVRSQRRRNSRGECYIYVAVLGSATGLPGSMERSFVVQLWRQIGFFPRPFAFHFSSLPFPHSLSVFINLSLLFINFGVLDGINFKPKRAGLHIPKSFPQCLNSPE